jgi:hypothetical protein
VNTFHPVIKTNQFKLYGVEVAVCSQINTKHINTVCAEYQFLIFNPAGARALKG